MKHLTAAFGLALLANSSLGGAESGGSSQSPADPSPVQLAEEAIPASSLDDHELDALRGGDEFVVSNQTLTGLTTGNVINGDYTAGNVTISDSAFSSFTGMGNILINTGAQVSLQTGMNVTINVSP
jgi:hypothetical protein